MCIKTEDRSQIAALLHSMCGTAKVAAFLVDKRQDWPGDVERHVEHLSETLQLLNQLMNR